MKQLIAGLLVLIMCLFTVNGALFIHIHVMPDGTFISHAHPFSKKTDDPKGNHHQHSSIEFFVLNQLNILALGVSLIFVLMAVSKPVTIHFLAEDPHLSPLAPFSPGRAPPDCLY
jgi:hypothetical protein